MDNNDGFYDNLPQSKTHSKRQQTRLHFTEQEQEQHKLLKVQARILALQTTEHRQQAVLQQMQQVDPIVKDIEEQKGDE